MPGISTFSLNTAPSKKLAYMQQNLEVFNNYKKKNKHRIVTQIVFIVILDAER